MRPDDQTPLSSARWHLHDFDAARGTARLLQLEEADYYVTSFLDHRVEPLASAECELSIAELEAALLQGENRHPGPTLPRHPGDSTTRHPGDSTTRHPGDSTTRHPGLDPGSTSSSGPMFIFHLGHCGSTLLSRALSASPNVLPVREPLTLRRLAADAGSIHLLPLAIAAHARVFHPGQVAVIKATSTCNSLIEPLLAADENSRAILMMVN
ncbi:MAG: hypothetical protein ACREB3_16555, partial [Burkholderiales bacterium]